LVSLRWRTSTYQKGTVLVKKVSRPSESTGIHSGLSFLLIRNKCMRICIIRKGSNVTTQVAINQQ